MILSDLSSQILQSSSDFTSGERFFFRENEFHEFCLFVFYLSEKNKTEIYRRASDTEARTSQYAACYKPSTCRAASFQTKILHNMKPMVSPLSTTACLLPAYLPACFCRLRHILLRSPQIRDSRDTPHKKCGRQRAGYQRWCF